MNNSTKLMFITIVCLSTLMAVSANSWLSAWMGLEINLMAFIPLMNNINNVKTSEASMKYFLIQALASSFLLFTTMIYYMKFNMISQLTFYNNYSELMILSALMTKSGTAPFHFWFPEVMESLSWMNCLILMTWQKLAPLALISYLSMNLFIKLVVIITALIGALGGLNQTSLRKIMAFSSINHLGWMLSGMLMNNNIWLTYFIIYSYLNMAIVLMFNLFKLFHFNQMFSRNTSPSMLKLMMGINLLSLGGLPPFLGFIPKWFIIQTLSTTNQMMMMVSLIMMTLITLFFYLRMCFSCLMLTYPEINWTMPFNWKNTSYTLCIILTFNSTFSLPMIPLLYFMI